METHIDRVVSIGKLEDSVGVHGTASHVAVDVTTTTGLAIAANASRLCLVLINDSDSIIYLGFGASAVVNEGIRLNAAGGMYEMSRLRGNLYAGAINAIHGATGTKRLLVTEGV